jgi:hypothetical protein
MMIQFMVLIASTISSNVASKITLTQSFDGVFQLLLTASNDSDFVSGFCEVGLFIKGEWKVVVGGFAHLTSTGIILTCDFCPLCLNAARVVLWLCHNERPTVEVVDAIAVNFIGKSATARVSPVWEMEKDFQSIVQRNPGNFCSLIQCSSARSENSSLEKT